MEEGSRVYKTSKIHVISWEVSVLIQSPNVTNEDTEIPDEAIMYVFIEGDKLIEREKNNVSEKRKTRIMIKENQERWLRRRNRQEKTKIIGDKGSHADFSLNSHFIQMFLCMKIQ